MFHSKYMYATHAQARYEIWWNGFPQKHREIYGWGWSHFYRNGIIFMTSLPLTACALSSLSNMLLQTWLFQLCIKLELFCSDVSLSFKSIQRLDEDSVCGNFAGVPNSLEKLESESHKSKHVVVLFLGVLETKGSNLWSEIIVTDWFLTIKLYLRRSGNL